MVKMAKIERSSEAVCDFFGKDQFLDSFCRELYVVMSLKHRCAAHVSSNGTIAKCSNIV